MQKAWIIFLILITIIFMHGGERGCGKGEEGGRKIWREGWEVEIWREGLNGGTPGGDACLAGEKERRKI